MIYRRFLIKLPGLPPCEYDQCSLVCCVVSWLWEKCLPFLFQCFIDFSIVQLNSLQLHMTSPLHCVMPLMCCADVFRVFQCVLQRCACQRMMCAESVLSRMPSPFSWTADCDYRCGLIIVGPAVSKKTNREEAADVVSPWFVVPAQYPARIPWLEPWRF